jgi:hypothetical protein
MRKLGSRRFNTNVSKPKGFKGTRLRRGKVMELKMIEQEAPVEFNMRKIRDIAQRTMKEKGLTENDVRKTLGVKRYEK